MARRKPPAALAADAAGGALALRDRLFELAGFDIVEQAAITRRVIDKFCQLMNAQKITRLVVNNGLHSSEVVEFTDEDGALQARAAAELRDTLGLQPSKTQPGGSAAAGVQVNVTLVQPPDASRMAKVRSQVVDITPDLHKGALRAPVGDVDRQS